MLLFALTITICAVWSTIGQIRNAHKKSITIEETPGWTLDGDRWVWGYAEDLTPTQKTKQTIPYPLEPIVKPTAGDNRNNGKPPPQAEEEFVFYNINQIRAQSDKKLIDIIMKNATIAELINSLCSPYNPPVPDFTGPDMRISDIKCQQNIWKMKLEKEKERRRIACLYEKYKLTGDTSNIPTTVGGRTTLPGEFPHMGAIGWKGRNGDWQFKCGSSLISPKFVLTAAHCTSAPESDTSLADLTPKIVRLSHKNIVRGLPSKTVGMFDIKIMNIISHPEYKPPRKYYDIALMELEREVGFSQLVQPSCLWGHTDINKLGSVATLTGWGVLAEGSLDISPELQAAVLDIIDSDKCAQYLRAWCSRNWCGVQDHQLCAGKLSGGVDACQGDSGSPLQVKIPLDVETTYNMYYVIGVTSFGVGCAQPNLPGVYTRVSSFIDWIENIVWPQ